MVAGRTCRPALLALIAVLAWLSPAGARAQNLTYGEIKFGVLSHDTHLLGGKEHGIDLNPEFDSPSPVPDWWAEQLPAYISWAVQPRFAMGAEFNTSHYTNQYYLGASWKWQLAGNLLRPGDGITFGIFFGPGFNDGEIVSASPDRKSLGSHVLFREAIELGYRITPTVEISGFLDHVSNAGFARYNQSLNDLGARIGVRF